MANDWSRLTDNELADEAQQGLRGQGATVEMMRRLKEAGARQLAASETLTRWIAWLTFALAVFGAIQLALLITELS